MDRKSRLRSRIATKVARRMLVIYVGIYVAILAILLGVLTPRLYSDSLSRTSRTVSLVTGELASLQKRMDETLALVSSSRELDSLVAEYGQEGSASNEAKVSLLLNALCTAGGDILSMTIETPSHHVLSSALNSYVDEKAILYATPHYADILAGLRGSNFSPVLSGVFHTQFTELGEYYDVVCYSKRVSFQGMSCCLTLFFDVSPALKRCAALSSSYLDGYLVVNRYGDVMYNAGLDSSVLNDDSLHPNRVKGSSRIADGVLLSETIPATGWTVVAYSSYTTLLHSLLVTMAIITGLYLLSPMLYAAFLQPAIRKQLMPLKHLSDTMSSYPASDTFRCDVNTDDEIGELSATFNSMLDRIGEQIRDIREREHENAVVNYKLLATQVDPHFIYNTMNIINIAARQDNPRAVIDINSALIKILQERLSSKLAIHDTIRSEMNTIIQYETIMGYRYHNRVSVHYEVDEALMDMKMPKNILQPLVENAFYHGFSSAEDEVIGNIDIVIYSVDESIVIEVSDDGRGIAPERLEQINSSAYSIYEDKKPHIGLDNIRQRLAYIYKGGHRMDIHSTEGHGTNVVITIPLTVPEDEFWRA